MIKIKEITPEDLACLLAIIIGGIFTILNPSKIKEGFEYTVIAIVLIKFFW